MPEQSNKRKQAPISKETKPKRQKNWQTPKQAQWSRAGKEIHIGVSGIWITCDRGREGKCAAEILDLFEDYGQKIYPNAVSSGKDENNSEDEDEPEPDIEKAISSEISEIKTAKTNGLFKVIRPELECVIFIQTKKPVDPVSFVHTICEDAAAGNLTRRCRHALRLTPATSTGKAHEKNFKDLARQVIEPVFHAEGVQSKTFAIRYTSRNHHVLKRDEVIKTAAAIVGDKHKVNLDNPELVIIVEVYKTICTMAVVDGSYNTLKRYNLAELSNAITDKKNG